MKRITAALQQHMRMETSADTRDMRLSYVPYLKKKLTAPLVTQGREKKGVDRSPSAVLSRSSHHSNFAQWVLGAEGVEEVISVMEHYNVTRVDWDAIVELDQVGGGVLLCGNFSKFVFPAQLNPVFLLAFYSWPASKILWKHWTRKPKQPLRELITRARISCLFRTRCVARPARAVVWGGKDNVVS